MISRIGITIKNFRQFRGAVMEIEKASFPSPWSVSGFKGELKNPLSHFWGLLKDGRLIGYLCFWMFAGEIHLLNIAVHPEERRKGYGRRLLGQMVEAGLKHRIKILWLEVRPSNFAARVLYEKMGFREAGRRPGYYREMNEDAIVMSLSLKEKEPEIAPETGHRPENISSEDKTAGIACPFYD